LVDNVLGKLASAKKPARLSTHVSIAGVDSGYVLEVLRDNADKARWLLRRSEFSKYVIDEPPPSPPGLWERIKSYL
ncbi:MAG: hypothetical protein AAFN78_17975, partial [Pseudomonadota bacterium]